VPPALAAGLLDALHQLQSTAAGDAWPQLEPLVEPLQAGEPAPLEPVDLTAPAPVLRELLLVAIDEAGESLGRRCTALLRGDATVAAVRGALAELGGLLGLLEGLDAAP
jgi:hypothetical protein